MGLLRNLIDQGQQGVTPNYGVGGVIPPPPGGPPGPPPGGPPGPPPGGPPQGMLGRFMGRVQSNPGMLHGMAAHLRNRRRHW